jgi:endonuclease III
MADWSSDRFAQFHAVTKRLGQEVCRWDEPECGRCPLVVDCPTGTARIGAVR